MSAQSRLDFREILKIQVVTAPKAGFRHQILQTAAHLAIFAQYQNIQMIRPAFMAIT